MTRIQRDIKRALQQTFDGARVEFQIGRKHDFVEVTLPGGQSARVTFAGSPSSVEATVRNVVRDIRARFATPTRRSA